MCPNYINPITNVWLLYRPNSNIVLNNSPILNEIIVKAMSFNIYTAVVQKNVTLFISLCFLETLTDFYKMWTVEYSRPIKSKFAIQQLLVYLSKLQPIHYFGENWCLGLHLPARQCASTACASNIRATAAWNFGVWKFIPADLRLQNNPDLNPVDWLSNIKRDAGLSVSDARRRRGRPTAALDWRSLQSIGCATQQPESATT